MATLPVIPHSGNVVVAGENPNAPAAHRKKFTAVQKAIPYNPLEDPSLQEFFARSTVQKHLMKNGWFASYAVCASCGRADRGPIKLCDQCQRFFHITCLPTAPITNDNVSVLLLHCTSEGVDVTPIQTMLMGTGHFSKVDILDVHQIKGRQPNLFKPYDAILVMALNTTPQNLTTDAGGWPDPDALGDILADFVMIPHENGENSSHNDDTNHDLNHHHVQQHRGGIVVAPLTHWETIGGKWRRFKLMPLLPGRQKGPSHLMMDLAEDKSNHAVLTGVRNFAGGEYSYHVSGAVNESGGHILARWANGLPLVVVLDDHQNVDRGRVISLNFLPLPHMKRKKTDVEKDGENDDDHKTVTFWDPETDGITLLSNALRFVARPTYQAENEILICHDCESGYMPHSPGRLADHEHPNAPSIKKVMRGQPYKDAIDESNRVMTRIETPASGRKLERDRDPAIADLHLLKEKFRRKFREQIHFSEQKKHMVQSRLDTPHHKEDQVKPAHSPAKDQKIHKVKQPKEKPVTLPQIEPPASSSIPEPKQENAVQDEARHRRQRPKGGENAAKRQEMLAKAAKSEPTPPTTVTKAVVTKPKTSAPKKADPSPSKPKNAAAENRPAVKPKTAANLIKPARPVTQHQNRIGDAQAKAKRDEKKETKSVAKSKNDEFKYEDDFAVVKTMAPDEFRDFEEPSTQETAVAQSQTETKESEGPSEPQAKPAETTVLAQIIPQEVPVVETTSNETPIPVQPSETNEAAPTDIIAPANQQVEVVKEFRKNKSSESLNKSLRQESKSKLGSSSKLSQSNLRNSKSSVTKDETKRPSQSSRTSLSNKESGTPKAQSVSNLRSTGDRVPSRQGSRKSIKTSQNNSVDAPS